MQVLRWTGTAFEPAFELTDRELLYGITVGDSDGVAGEDLLFGTGPDGTIRRLAWSGDEMQLDEAQVFLAAVDGWIVGVADGTIVLSLGSRPTAALASCEGAAIVERSKILLVVEFALVGDGSDALVLDLRDSRSNQGHRHRSRSTIWVCSCSARSVSTRGPRSCSESPIPGRPLEPKYLSIRRIDPGRPPRRPSGVGLERHRDPAGRQRWLRGAADRIDERRSAHRLAGPDDSWCGATAPTYSPPPRIALLAWGGITYRRTIGPRWRWSPLVELRVRARPGRSGNRRRRRLRSSMRSRSARRRGRNARGRGGWIPGCDHGTRGFLAIVVNGRSSTSGRWATSLSSSTSSRAPGQGRTRTRRSMRCPGRDPGKGITEQWAGTFIREPPESASLHRPMRSPSARRSPAASPGSMVDADGVRSRPMPVAFDVDAPIWPSGWS